MAKTRVIGTKEAAKGFRDSMVAGWEFGYDAAVRVAEGISSGDGEAMALVRKLIELRPELLRLATEAAQEAIEGATE